MSFLDIKDLSKSFGSWRAVNRVSLEVSQGEILAVIGPNGAGKTTLFNLISGRLRPDHGRVLFQDEDITEFPPHKIAKKGISRSFQVANVFANLTVLQNIRVPVLAARSKSRIFFRPVRYFSDENHEALGLTHRLGLGDKATMIADLLSYGDRRKLEFAMAVAMRPSLLLLDEPTAGMNQLETESTVSLMKELVTSFGLTLVLTEHDMKVVFSLAERIIVMHQGGILSEGTPETIRNDARVRSIYLGEEDWLY